MCSNAFQSKWKMSVSILTLEEFGKLSICNRNCNYPLHFVRSSERFSVFAVCKLTWVFFSNKMWFRFKHKLACFSLRARRCFFLRRQSQAKRPEQLLAYGMGPVGWVRTLSSEFRFEIYHQCAILSWKGISALKPINITVCCSWVSLSILYTVSPPFSTMILWLSSDFEITLIQWCLLWKT